MNGSTVMNHMALKFRTYLKLSQSVLMLLLSLLSIADVRANDERGKVKSLMHSFVLEYVKMSPHLASEASFESAEGRSVIKSSLEALQKKTQSSRPKELNKSLGFKITYNLLANHISQTKEIFDRGEYAYARMRVNGIGNLCAGCHMQSPSISRFSAFEFITGKKDELSYENANFLFTIRRYDEALAMFDQLIRGYPKTKVSEEQLQNLYRQKLGILARVERKSDFATSSLTEDLKNPELPAKVRESVKNWIASISKWDKKTDPEKLSTEKLIEYVSKSLPSDMKRKAPPTDPDLLNILRLSGLLYERLFNEPESKYSQELLFLLAQFERNLSPYYWYSMNEIYLKECVVQFPKQSFSRKCYDAYEAGMRERYAKGMPEGVRQSLEVLKDYL